MCDGRANNLLRPPELDGTIVEGDKYLIKSILTQDRSEFRLSHSSKPTFDPFCQEIIKVFFSTLKVLSQVTLSLGSSQLSKYFFSTSSCFLVSDLLDKFANAKLCLNLISEHLFMMSIDNFFCLFGLCPIYITAKTVSFNSKTEQELQ